MNEETKELLKVRANVLKEKARDANAKAQEAAVKYYIACGHTEPLARIIAYADTLKW